MVGEDEATRQQGRIPRWVPVSLLVLSSVALVVPVILLRKSRASSRLNALGSAPPPRSRNIDATRTSSNAKALRPKAMQSNASAHRSPAPAQTSPHNAGDDEFNGALYTMKAFGIATLLVSAGSIASIWGIKTAMGVKDTKEFATRMRSLILNKMPTLSERIHRLTEAEPVPGQDQTASGANNSADEESTAWNWLDAEKRLKDAYEKDGFIGWANAALNEVEAEHRVKRIQRERLDKASASSEPSGVRPERSA